jgi:quinol monooxygenase YgiN
MAKTCLIVELDILPSEVEGFTRMFQREFVARSVTEDGCELYELWQDPKQPTRMAIIEIWRDRAALDVHLAQDWFKVWAPEMDRCLATPLTVREMASLTNP